MINKLMNPKRLLSLSLQLIAFLGVNLSAQVLPVSGVPIPELVPLDTAMEEFMQANDIGAGILAVMKEGLVVYRHAFGWQDEERMIPLRPDAVMRIASVTKPFTAAAIRHLVFAYAVSLNSRVFSGDTPGSGILELIPFGNPDSRLADITVNHLLQHEGGWDRDAPGIPDHTYQELQIAAEMGVPSPPSRVNVLRWIMGQPLQFDPGSDVAYSNIGYLALGLIVEEVSGKDLLTYLQDHVLSPIGVDHSQVLYGRTFKSDQDSREPYYDSAGSTATNVFYPAFSNEPVVERPYGSWNHEARTGQGAIVADPFAILAYLNAYQVAGSGIGGPRPAAGNWKWSHTGALWGTNSLARQRGDGINYTVIFNKRPLSGTSYVIQMRTTLDSIFDSEIITSWPVDDVRFQEVPLSTIELGTDPIEILLQSSVGRYYQLMNSTDLHIWNLSAPPFIGNGSRLSFAIDPEAMTSMYYRFEVRQ